MVATLTTEPLPLRPCWNATSTLRSDTNAEYFYDYAAQDPINGYDLSGTVVDPCGVGKHKFFVNGKNVCPTGGDWSSWVAKNLLVPAVAIAVTASCPECTGLALAFRVAFATGITSGVVGATVEKEPSSVAARQAASTFAFSLLGSATDAFAKSYFPTGGLKIGGTAGATAGNEGAGYRYRHGW